MTSTSEPHLFAGKYRRGDALGDGTTHNAKVYKAFDTDHDDEPVAVKILRLDHPSTRQRDMAWSMYSKETRALQDVDHEAIVKLIDKFYDRNEAGIVLELIEGGRTAEDVILDAQATPPVRKSLRWKVMQLLRILDALSFTHQRQIIHRDVKLRNILYDGTSNSLKLADFGIAKIADQFDVRTVAGSGSPPFSAPEQLLRRDARRQADLYALGLVIASVLTDQIPNEDFRQADMPAYIEPLRGQVAKPEVFDNLARTLVALLNDDPEARPDRWEIKRSLDALLGNLADRPEAYIRLIHRQRDYIEHTLDMEIADFLGDLNDGIRARCAYRDDEDRLLTVWLYGRTVWLQAHQDRDDNDRLVVVRSGRIRHIREIEERDQASPIPHRIQVSATKDAKELLDLVFEQFRAQIDAETSRKRREDFLSLPLAYLQLRESSMRDLWLECSWVSGTRQGSGAIKQAADGYAVTPGDRVRLRVWATSREAPDDEHLAVDEELATTLADFAETFERAANLHHNDRNIGSIISIDVSKQEISVEISTSMILRFPHENPDAENVFSAMFMAHNAGLERSLQREREALEAFILGQTTNTRLPELLLRPKHNRLRPIASRPLIQQGLKGAAQVQQLIEHALSAKDIYAIQGPPGTGKTTTITELVLQILSETPGARILLTSQNNDAVENAMQKAHKVASKLGKPVRLLREVSELRTRANPLGFSETFTTWVSTTVQRSQAEAESRLGRQVTLSPEREASVRATLAEWQGQLPIAEDVKEDFLLNVQVFGVTCLRLPTLFRRYPHLQDVSFDWVIVDEAARAHASELLVALNRGQRIILVGDQKQLPPHLSQEDEKALEAAGFNSQDVRTSLFEKLFTSLPETNRSRLNMQFRMHESIARMVSKLYYAVDGVELTSDNSDSDMTLPMAAFDRPERAFWIDIRGQQDRVEDSTSQFNHEEARRIKEVLERLEKQARRPAKESPEQLSVAIITPYELQRQHLQREIVPEARERWRMLDIIIDTVDAFQGKEADIVILSLVTTEGGRNRFVGDPHRLNVAFSRAMRLLLIFGDRERAKRDPELKRVVEAIPSKNHIQWSNS